VFRPAASRDEARAKVSFSANLSYFVCCATVLERKGMSDLAQAWRLFAARRPTWRLIVIGPVVSRRLARELREAGPDSVTLVGRVGPERVLAYLQAADGYVQSSHTEGIANATMEAMAVGVPVVTTDAGSQRELVRDGESGWLVPVHDVPALAGAMTELADDPLRARALGHCARETMIANFDPLAHATRLSDLLTDLYEERGGEDSDRVSGSPRRTPTRTVRTVG
jgi:glycosyltransferase involved in cell wall biosynthesis